MKKIKINLLKSFCFILILGFKANVFSQKSISEITQDEGKFWKGKQGVLATKSSGKPYKSGQGVIAYYPALKIPKKVALISFYLYDFGSYKSRSYGSLKLGSQFTTYKSAQMTAEGAKKAVSYFYSSWIDEEKNNIKTTHGVELITPDEFTPEQLNVYNDYEAKASSFGILATQEDNQGTILETPDNYKPIIDGVPGDYKIAESLGLLAKDLGVDAVLIIVNEVNTSTDGNINLMQVGMYMYGPNPVPREEGKKYMGFNGAGRQEGNAYDLLKIKFNGDKGVPFYTINKKTKETNFNIDGIGLIYSKMLDGIYKHITEEHNEGKE